MRSPSSRRITLGYPSQEDEIAIIEKQQHEHPIDQIEAVASGDDLVTLQTVVRDVFVDDLVKQYITSLVAATRDHPTIYLGASPRGSLALFRTAQARALVRGRDYVLPDDVKALAEPVLAHRLIIRLTDVSQDKSGRASIAELLETVPVPGTAVKQ
jgi:MoxR-like ATPase